MRASGGLNCWREEPASQRERESPQKNQIRDLPSHCHGEGRGGVMAVARMGYGFFLAGVTPRKKELLESATFVAEQESSADVLFGTVGECDRAQKSALWAEALREGGVQVSPSWYKGEPALREAQDKFRRQIEDRLRKNPEFLAEVIDIYLR